MRFSALLVVAIASMTIPVLAADHAVEVVNNAFIPRNLTIEVGDTVTWTNTSGGVHNVHADDGSFRCATSCSGPGGNPSAAEWTVTLQFDDPGDIAYFCDLHGAPGGIGMAGVITVTGEAEPEVPEENFVIILPVAGSVQGASFFRTDARLLNPSLTDPITIAASYLPVGSDNSATDLVLETLEPRSAKIFADVVGSLLDQTGLGAIRLFSDRPFIASSRIFTDSDCETQQGGTFGQFVPAIAEEDALLFGIVPNLAVTDAFRSNVGIVNASTESNTIILHLVGPMGEMAQASVSLPPRGGIGPTAVAGLFGLSELSQENLFVTFEAAHPTIVYGSVVDNATADQIFVAPISDPALSGE